MQVQHHLAVRALAARRAARALAPWHGRRGGFLADVLGVAGAGEVEGEVAAGELADGDGAAHLEALGGTQGGQPLRAGADGVVEVERVGEVELPDDPAGAGERDRLVSNRRPSQASRRRASASAGMNRPIASSTSRSTWLGRVLCATGATCRSTNPAACGLSRIVCSATRRARHAARSPLVTRAQTRGSR
jgi:hypothetical protein